MDDCCKHDHAHTGAGENAAATSQRRSASVRIAFTVKGLDCAEEVSVLKRAVGPLVGGEAHLAFDVLNGRMLVLESAASAPAGAIQEAVSRTGMAAEQWHGGRTDGEGSDRSRRMQTTFTAASGAFVAAGIVLHAWFAGSADEALRLFSSHGTGGMPWPEIAAYAAAIGFGVRFVLPRAWSSARRLQPDMHLLMTIAVVGAVGIGEWFEAATVAFLFSLSLALESWSVARARRAIAALLDLAPTTVRLKHPDGTEAEVPAAEVPIGSHFAVMPGERLPLDGTVVSGASSVNQAPITGESVPVHKEAGAEVFAGTINGDGALEVQSTKAADDTTLARIIRMVEEAHARRARSEQWVEKFARVYTPAVIVVALAILVVPPLAFDASWAEWLYRALVLLVIACPCALVISTPVSIVSALAAAARHGVLVKGGLFIELPARLKAIALDKTGTVSRGEPAVVAVVPLNGHSEQELLERAAALEARSAHPLARAVTRAATARSITVRPAVEVEMMQGKGVTGRFDGERFWLGSHRYLEERGQENPELHERAEHHERQGQTVVVIGNERHVCGLLAIADTIRPESQAAVTALRAAGIAHLVLLTGDNRTTAEAIAAQAGIDEVHAELLPEDKVRVVEELVARYGDVAMVGDGVNDAPAMARASLGIAMGAAGSDAAIETADIALMTDDLARLPWLVRHSRRTLAVIRQNVVFALGVKALFVVLTFAGFATLWGAIAADLGASLLVVVNALRLLSAPRNLAGLPEQAADNLAAGQLTHGH
jgi:Cd2+/Zn2+-exporting ATPase